MNDWKDIHPGFTEKLQAEWEAFDLTYKKVKKWIDTGLEPKYAEFVFYIMSVNGLQSQTHEK